MRHRRLKGNVVIWLHKDIFTLQESTPLRTQTHTFTNTETHDPAPNRVTNLCPGLLSLPVNQAPLQGHLGEPPTGAPWGAPYLWGCHLNRQCHHMAAMRPQKNTKHITIKINLFTHLIECSIWINQTGGRGENRAVFNTSLSVFGIQTTPGLVFS